MDQVPLGRAGLKVSRLILGTMGMGAKSWRDWVLDGAASGPILRRALDLGITTFDTCDYYSAGESERILGHFVKETVPRDRVVLATKFGMPLKSGPNHRGYSRAHVTAAVEDSLRRLRTDYIDLYQTHIWDPTANLEELVSALDDLVRAGKIRHAGVTDMPAWQLAKAHARAELKGRTGFVSVQNHYNLLYREGERELVPLVRAEGLGWIPYSPMGRGFLCGTRSAEGWGTTLRAASDDFAQKHYFRDGDFTVAASVERVAARRGVEPAQIALAWVMGRPGLTGAVFGATKAAQVDAAVAALEIGLTSEEAAELEAGYQPRPIG